MDEHTRRLAREASAGLPGARTRLATALRRQGIRPPIGPGRIDPSLTIEYVYGGNATFTLLNPNTQQRHTFRVKRRLPFVQPNATPPPPPPYGYPYTVAAMTGPDPKQHGDWSSLGLLVSTTPLCNAIDIPTHTVFQPALHYEHVIPYADEFHWLITRLNTHESLDPIEVWHNGTCGRCGLPLIVPESITSGIGPICVRRKAQANQTRKGPILPGAQV